MNPFSSLFNYDITNILALSPGTCARVSLEVEFLEAYEEFLEAHAISNLRYRQLKKIIITLAVPRGMRNLSFPHQGSNPRPL